MKLLGLHKYTAVNLLPRECRSCDRAIHLVAALLLAAAIMVQSGCVGLVGADSSNQLVFSPNKIDFGSIAAGQKKTVTVTLTNTGDTAISLPQATIAPSAYSVTGLSLPATVGPGAILTFTAVFAPTAPGVVSGTIVVSSDNSSVPPESLALTGTGLNPSGPTILNQPTSQSVLIGQSATFSVTATGTDPLTYQWRKNGTAISGATAASYTTPPTVTSDGGAQFTVVVTDAVGTVTSSPATLTVSAVPVAPSITSQPANQIVTAGQAATFSVTASGTSPMNYQWRKNGANIGGATAASYTTPATASADNGSQYSVVVSNAAGSAVSNSATLTVNSLVTITSQPVSQTVTAGQTATFSVTATGSFAIAYQWRKNGVNISGANAATYTTPATTTADSGSQYSAVATSSAGSVVSNTAVLTVTSAPVAPSITSQPANQTVAAGQSATFTVGTSGTTPIAYQWKKNGATITGAAAASYTTPATTGADNGAQFTVVATNSVGTVTSNAATLTVNTPPAITSQPTGQSVLVGQTASFSVTASGTGPLSYQWKKNGTNVSGATAAAYTTPATSSSDNGAQFTVTVTNSAGTITSSAATLTVSSPPSITSQPSSATVVAGQTASFSVTATGTGPLSYQWKKNGANVSGATAASYTTPVTSTADNGSQFSVVVSNSAGNITSSAATLTVNAATLLLSANPTSLSFGTVTVGGSKTLSATISNAGNSSVTISSVSQAGAGFSASGVSSGVILAAGQTATLNVSFAPSGAGSASGSVTIASNATNSPTTINLTGSGQQPIQHTSTLSWTASTSTVVGYNAYRSTASGGPYTKLNSSVNTSTNYTDSTVQSGQTYYFVVTAVDSSGAESSYSNEVQGVIPTP